MATITIEGGSKAQVVKLLKRDGFIIRDYWKVVICPDCINNPSAPEVFRDKKTLQNNV